jgi:AAA15 family ATPase/GTPase
MKLIKLSYIDTNWELQDLELDTANLIVGKNSTGKSRTLSTIDLLYKMLTQKRDLNWGGKWEVIFKNHRSDIIEYNFSTSSKKHGVTHEIIKYNGLEVLKRINPDNALIKNSLTGTFEKIYPPLEKMIIHINRDVKKYPFLEEIASWAEQSFGFKFGNISPYAQFNKQEYDFLTAVEDIPTLFKGFKEQNKQSIIKCFNNIGYDIENISIQEVGNEIMVLYVKEVGIDKEIPHYRLSQGMFRTLSVLIFIEYLLSHKRPATIIIDDLCEGLDFSRASKLGELIFEKCISNDIQIIATSNDSFLMDVVDVKYWNVLYRNGKLVRTINIKNNHQMFEDFKYTGLSNFDFFSSDYIQKKSNK